MSDSNNILTLKTQTQPKLQIVDENILKLREETKAEVEFAKAQTKEIVVTAETVVEHRNGLTAIQLGKKLMEDKVKGVLSPIHSLKDAYWERTLFMREVVKEYETKTRDLIEPFTKRETDLKNKIKTYEIETERARLAEVARQKAEAEAKLQEAKKLIEANLPNAKAEDIERAQAQKKAEIDAAIEMENRRISSQTTNSGKLQKRFMYKLDEENIDKVKIVKFLAANPQYIDIIDINKAACHKWFKPTLERTDVVEVPGLPYIQDVSFNLK